MVGRGSWDRRDIYLMFSSTGKDIRFKYKYNIGWEMLGAEGYRRDIDYIYYTALRRDTWYILRITQRHSLCLRYVVSEVKWINNDDLDAIMGQVCSDTKVSPPTWSMSNDAMGQGTVTIFFLYYYCCCARTYRFFCSIITFTLLLPAQPVRPHRDLFLNKAAVTCSTR